MASEETIKYSQTVDKYYEEMRKVVPNFQTSDREHMLITSAIAFSIKNN